MTDGTAGWFRDPTDPALARWHDGDRWTEQTLVIADQTPGSEPAPPEPAPAPASTFEDTDSYGGYTDGPSNDDGLSDRVRGLPMWAKVLAPLVVVAVLGIAFLLTSGGDDDGGKTETAGTEAASLNEAVEAARDAGLTEEVSDARAAALIERICDAAQNPSDVDELGQDLGNLPAATPSDLRREIRALGKGADERCAKDLADAPDLINDLQDGAAVAFATTTTAITLVPDGTGDTVPGGADGGATTGGTSGSGGKTNTTKKGATSATTAKPPVTTTTLPTVKSGTPCSPEGAKAKNKVAGGPLTCRPKCFGSGTGSLQWQTPGSCQTLPTTDPNGTIPTTTSSTTGS